MPKIDHVPTDLVITEKGREVSKKPVRTATPVHPRLVNRGPAGLLHRIGPIKDGLREAEVAEKAQVTISQAAYKIIPALQQLAVPLDSLTLDPMNARLHP